MEIDWHRILFSDQPYAFFIEILIRTPTMFLAVVAILRLTGKRGVQQLSIFEMVMIISLGSAAGDSMFYEDVGLLHAVAVFALILLVYKLLILVIAKSKKAEKLLEGEPLYIIRDGRLCINQTQQNQMGSDEFFGELRGHNVEHLGQVRCAILEDTGKLSVFYYSDNDVKAGLPILPDDFNRKIDKINFKGYYSCDQCGNTQKHYPSEIVFCERCANTVWIASLDNKRIA